MITKDQILAKLAERKKLAENKQPEVKKPVYRKTLAEQGSKVVKENVLSGRQSGPRTISEDIKQRVEPFKSKEQQYLYKTLAENMVKAQRTISEATQAGTGVYGVTGQGAGVGLMKTYFDIFFGYFPNLIVPMLASTQPIKTEKAMIFYYQTVAGSDKGNVTKGTALITPFKVNTDKNYTSNLVNLPAISETGAYDSTAKAIWGPYIARSLQLKSGNVSAVITWSSDTAFTATFADPVNGAIAISGGAITLGTGTIKVDMTLDKAPSSPIEITYQYDNKYAPTEVPELNADIDSREITAYPRTIKTNYSFQAGFGFEAQFGVKLEDKLAEAAMYELKRETDLDFVFEIMNAAPAQVVWNRGAGVANGLYEFHKQSFRDAVVGASNYIFKISKKVRGNVLLVGINAQTIVETLPDFKGESFGSQLGGPTVIGKLKDIKVIAIPDLGENDWAVIYKNEKDNLDAGIVFAPYIPVVATSPVTLDDFVIRRAYTTSYGKLVTNADYFVRGSIVNDPMALPVYLVTKDGTTTDMGVIGTDAVVAAAPAFPA